MSATSRVHCQRRIRFQRGFRATFALIEATTSSAVLLLLMGCRQIVDIEERRVFTESEESSLFRSCGLPTRKAECAACMEQQCCPQARRCADDAECVLTEECVQTCPEGDSACRLRCTKQWEPVSDLQGGLQACRQASCAAECGPWDCLGNVQWSVPAELPATITISAIAMCWACSDFGGVDANPGVHVRVCSVADPECNQELTSDDTGPDGSVSLTLPTAVGTQRNPLAVFLEFSKQGWLDSLLLLNTPPLSFDFAVGPVYMDQRADVDQIASALGTAYDLNLALVKLSVSNCNLQSSTGIDISWADPGQAAIDASFNLSEWDVFAVNLPVPDTRSTRVVARLADPTAVLSENEASLPVIASATLVLRRGAITLAPFVTPTP